MKIMKMKGDKKEFAIASLTFTELKIIKDACELFGQQGSARAAEIFAEIDRQMNQITI
ncbi:MAG: hypothetical protein H7A21_02370 [Spirochaetales bacterium]|nr:hypothetical protein [Leptospiraceae bacterium]MCP5480253.1 hypothetical protein [Spirochaetales bacterium]MCP5486348.1 hypothetical protein [Spirochaetales bacterium]